jgi:hypothetical protein
VGIEVRCDVRGQAVVVPRRVALTLKDVDDAPRLTHVDRAFHRSDKGLIANFVVSHFVRRAAGALSDRWTDRGLTERILNCSFAWSISSKSPSDQKCVDVVFAVRTA